MNDKSCCQSSKHDLAIIDLRAFYHALYRWIQKEHVRRKNTIYRRRKTRRHSRRKRSSYQICYNNLILRNTDFTVSLENSLNKPAAATTITNLREGGNLSLRAIILHNIKHPVFQPPKFWGLPWRLTGEEPACRYRRHRFNPWSGKILHATEQLSPYWAYALESRSCNYWAHMPRPLKPVCPRACDLQ